MFPSLPPPPPLSPPLSPPFLLPSLQEGKLDEYRSYHDNIWPEVAAGLRAAGITQLTIFMVCATYVCANVCANVCACVCVFISACVFVSACGWVGVFVWPSLLSSLALLLQCSVG